MGPTSACWSPSTLPSLPSTVRPLSSACALRHGDAYAFAPFALCNLHHLTVLETAITTIGTAGQITIPAVVWSLASHVSAADTLNMILSASSTHKGDAKQRYFAGKVSMVSLSSQLGKVSCGPQRHCHPACGRHVGRSNEYHPCAWQSPAQPSDRGRSRFGRWSWPTGLRHGRSARCQVLIRLLAVQAVQQQVHLEQLKKQVREDNQRRRDLSRCLHTTSASMIACLTASSAAKGMQLGAPCMHLRWAHTDEGWRHAL